MSKYQNFNYNAEYIIERYTPLINNLVRTYMAKYGYLTTPQDLEAEALLRIPELIKKYDPKLGVDFDYYIKNLLNWDMLHFVEKLIKINNRQTAIKEDQEFAHPEIFSEPILASIPSDIILTPSQRYYLEAVVIENKSAIAISRDLGKSLAEVRQELSELADWIVEVAHL